LLEKRNPRFSQSLTLTVKSKAVQRTKGFNGKKRNDFFFQKKKKKQKKKSKYDFNFQ
jgi:hypothetical protein